MATLNQVTNQALSLSAVERVDLAERLLESIDDFADPEIEEHWRKLAVRRLTELENGEVTGVSADTVHDRIRAALHETRLPSRS